MAPQRKTQALGLQMILLFWTYRFVFFVLLKNCAELGNCDFEVFLHRLWSKICSRILDDTGNFHNVHEESIQRYHVFLFVFFHSIKI